MALTEHCAQLLESPSWPEEIASELGQLGVPASTMFAVIFAHQSAVLGELCANITQGNTNSVEVERTKRAWFPT